MRVCSKLFGEILPGFVRVLQDEKKSIGPAAQEDVIHVFGHVRLEFSDRKNFGTDTF
jgi:hypothetical protein